MKKFISIVLTSLIIGSAITGCGNGSANNADDQGKISVVTTIFPEYDWVKEITRGNENVDITFLLSKGVDLHSFQPSADYGKWR
ncbi:MAG: zinc ABC transporter substrate-binding protein [Lachnospiraceae bacterium]|nr:zinc ABC transporter substrate-binding protein [Lachnospiraceae bacterium]